MTVTGRSELTTRNGWLDLATSGPDADGFYTLTATPKRRYWLHLSYWRMVVASRSLMPTAKPIEENE